MVNKYQSVEEVPVWQKAHELTLVVYKVTKEFPGTEVYGLTSQLRRASSSIPANITEGFYRNSTKELLQFLYNARGSCGETLYHSRLALDLGYLTKVIYTQLKDGYDEVGKQLNGWIKSLRKKL
ncbi:four helix bundle protein [Candidatus Microgenomates bacterium]|nr:four helix bundle protein [Candidatus Microgenomates bacterium]